ncbi:MAG: hypothetical protein ACJ8BW_05045, partial [Ktedonobacteraceae bacterium]
MDVLWENVASGPHSPITHKTEAAPQAAASPNEQSSINAMCTFFTLPWRAQSFKEGTMSNVHLRFVRACWRIGGAAALVAVILLVFPTPSAGAATTGNDGLNIQTVCFTVHNTGDPLPSTLYGLRYTYGHPKNSTPAIVLVHGIASSTANWDFTPSWSVARNLARAG